MPDAPVEAESQAEAIAVNDSEAPEPEGEATVTVQDGRRRGRRRVMKKKKVKDEDGYLGKQNFHALTSVPPDVYQLREKKLYGSPSRKKNPSPRSSNQYP
jgi:DNA polymerase delta subunit 3